MNSNTLQAVCTVIGTICTVIGTVFAVLTYYREKSPALKPNAVARSPGRRFSFALLLVGVSLLAAAWFMLRSARSGI